MAEETSQSEPPRPLPPAVVRAFKGLNGGAADIISRALKERVFFVKSEDPFPPFGVGLQPDGVLAVALLEPRRREPRDDLISRTQDILREWAQSGKVDSTGLYFSVHVPAADSAKVGGGQFAFGILEHHSQVARSVVLHFQRTPSKEWEATLMGDFEAREAVVFA